MQITITRGSWHDWMQGATSNPLMPESGQASPRPCPRMTSRRLRGILLSQVTEVCTDQLQDVCTQLVLQHLACAAWQTSPERLLMALRGSSRWTRSSLCLLSNHGRNPFHASLMNASYSNLCSLIARLYFGLPYPRYGAICDDTCLYTQVPQSCTLESPPNG